MRFNKPNLNVHNVQDLEDILMILLLNLPNLSIKLSFHLINIWFKITSNIKGPLIFYKKKWKD